MKTRTRQTRREEAYAGRGGRFIVCLRKGRWGSENQTRKGVSHIAVRNREVVLERDKRIVRILRSFRVMLDLARQFAVLTLD